jgi:DNA modification methylase
MTEASLRLEWIDPAELEANPSNWRRHPPAQALALADVIAEVGWAGALLYNERTQRLIDGHCRKELFAGKAKVPVLIGSWDEADEAKILATLDPLAALAEANTEALDKLLHAVSTDSEFLQEMLAGLAADNGLYLPPPEPAEDPGPQIDRAGELQQKWQTERGQLWEIPSESVSGKCHRLLAGDSTDAGDVARLMGGDKARLCATDPPYLVDYTGERPNDSGKDWTATYHEVDIKNADGFFRALFQNILRVIAPNAAIYCWHAHKRQAMISRVWEDLGILDHQQIVWVKPTAVFGRVFWHFRHEPCMMGWVKGSMPDHDGDQSLDSVWEVDWDGKQRIVGNAHPTEKPAELFARPMRKHTQKGDICFEPCSGSGTQLVAAEQTARICYGVEIEPAYVAVALERLAGMGLSPRLQSPAMVSDRGPSDPST